MTEKEPEGFVKDHYDRKQQRKQRRKKDQKGGAGKKMHRVGQKDKWRWDGGEKEE